VRSDFGLNVIDFGKRINDGVLNSMHKETLD